MKYKRGVEAITRGFWPQFGVSLLQFRSASKTPQKLKKKKKNRFPLDQKTSLEPSRLNSSPEPCPNPADRIPRKKKKKKNRAYTKLRSSN